MASQQRFVAGLLAHPIFGLTDAFMPGIQPGIVMWILMGISAGLYLRLAPAHLEAGEPEQSFINLAIRLSILNLTRPKSQRELWTEST